jgi:threonine/homoserine/homoserine lactone efflux protein
VLVFLGIFWASFLIGFSGALVPGPMLTVTVKEAARRGPWAGPLIVLGHGITEIAITIALILGVSSFTGDIRVRKVIAVVGGAFLVWMGTSMLRRVRNIEREISSEKGDLKSSSTPVLLGITTTLSNPYWFGWWGSIGASLLVAASGSGAKGIVAFVTGHVSSDLAWYTVVSYLVSLGLSYNKGSWYKILFAVCGVFLLLVGGFFVRYGFTLSASL